MQNGFDILEEALAAKYHGSLLYPYFCLLRSQFHLHPKLFHITLYLELFCPFFSSSSFIVLKLNSAILSKTDMDSSPLVAAAGLVALSPFLDSNTFPFSSSHLPLKWAEIEETHLMKLQSGWDTLAVPSFQFLVAGTSYSLVRVHHCTEWARHSSLGDAAFERYDLQKTVRSK